MTKTPLQRKRIALGARLAIVAGAILALTGSSLGTAQAQEQGGPERITICHRTKATNNPYTQITVKASALDVEDKDDHTDHDGPVFDFEADPAVAYPAPHDGSQWGDIIPQHGDFPGLNWTEEGQAVYEADCQGPDEPADPTCPNAGEVWDDENENGTIEEGECAVPFTCPAGTTWVDAGDMNDEIEATECVTDACPNDDGFQAPGTTCRPDACPNVDGFQADTTLCPVEVIGEVVTNTPVVEVKGATVAAAELPRTGKASLPLAELGLGLLLMGAGALIFARDEAATA
ncbi:MAG: hypothetical protein ACRDYW_09720 [Acidimicrobiales bacterium]